MQHDLGRPSGSQAIMRGHLAEKQKPSQEQPLDKKPKWGSFEAGPMDFEDEALQCLKSLKRIKMKP